MHNHYLKQFIVVLLTALFVSAIVPPGYASSGAAGIVQGTCDRVNLVETTLPWPADLHYAASEALCRRPADILPGDDRRLILTSLDLLNDGAAAIATVVMRPEALPERYESLLVFPSALVVLQREATGWRGAVQGTEAFTQLARAAGVHDDAAPLAPQGLPGSLNLKWPWKEGQQWVYTQGPHWINAASIDLAPLFAIPPDQREVVAAADGRVEHKCEDNIQVQVILSHRDGYATEYLHLDKNSASHLKKQLTQVRQGERLGITYNRFNYQSACGWGTGPHLHFSVGRWSNGRFIRESIVGTVISGYTLGRNNCFSKPGAQSLCLRALITSDNSPITLVAPGQSVNAEITGAKPRDDYYLDGAAGQEVTIEMIRTSGGLDPYLSIYRPNGALLALDNNSAGSLNARLVVRLPDAGRYRIEAKAINNQTGAYTLRVIAGAGSRDPDDNRWLEHDRWLDGRITPQTDEDAYFFNGIAGRIVGIRMNRTDGNLDSFLELYDPNGSRIATNDNGGGTDNNAWLVAVLPRNGVYRVKARSYQQQTTGAYRIRLRMENPPNYARDKRAYASSIEWPWLNAAKAFDGKLDTRWSSQFSDPQWICVDLGNNRTIDTVTLRWENAYGRRYGINVSTDGRNWRNVFWTDNGRGGVEVIQFPATTARYVCMYGAARGTRWGYSLWEMEVSNSAEAAAPTVPPDPEDKPPDTIAPLAPAPLPEDEVDPYLESGEHAQEVVPLAGGEPEPQPEMTVADAGRPSAAIVYVTPGYPGGGVVVYPDQTLTFEGEAADNDAEGDDPQIVAYEWRSNRDGVLSTERQFTRLAASLAFGEHTITFRARDNEGVWSEEVQVTIQVQPYQVFLPLTIR